MTSLQRSQLPDNHSKTTSNNHFIINAPQDLTFFFKFSGQSSSAAFRTRHLTSSEFEHQRAEDGLNSSLDIPFCLYLLQKLPSPKSRNDRGKPSEGQLEISAGYRRNWQPITGGQAIIGPRRPFVMFSHIILSLRFSTAKNNR
jgi:hypothetical protein